MTDIEKLKDTLNGPKEILHDVCPRPGACFCDGACKKNRVKYRRSDLPKEVDLRSLYLNEQNGGAVATMRRIYCAASYNKAIDHLVALGVIINVKPAENKES